MTDSKDKNSLYRGPSPKREDTRGPRTPRRDDQRPARSAHFEHNEDTVRRNDQRPKPARTFERSEVSAPRPRFERDENRSTLPRTERTEYSPRQDFADAEYEQRPVKIKEFRIYGLKIGRASCRERVLLMV